MINVTVDSNVVRLKFDEVAKGIKNFKPALQETGDFLVKRYVANFKIEGREWGEPWKPLTPETIAAKARAGYGGMGILVRTGLMRDSFMIQELNAYKVQVGNPVEYFKYHQTGTSRLPQRRMIGLNYLMQKDIVKIFTDYITKLVNGRSNY